MITKSSLLLTLFLVLSAAQSLNAQPRNLLQNADASHGKESWRPFGDTAVETLGGYSSFVVRNGGNFSQDVELPKDASGQFAVFVGRGSIDRVNSGGGITGIPYLYGYMMQPSHGPDEKEILAYLQGQGMLAQIRFVDEWANMWGVFEVPRGTTKIRFLLCQGLQKNVPHDGSAARFTTLGLYLFPTKEDAGAFVSQYR
ncbi:MAG TPA: hypothetical protein VL907_11515 [Pyrinomonadaceae bacterium]|jgi:hypothetical protein|nr:hypothetical protein [Pyrinomonadaceae bacterium]